MKNANKTEIGWREFVALPRLGINQIKAKVDTGARSSALHAVNIREFERDGDLWVDFEVPLAGRIDHRRISAPIHDQRAIKNTSGIPMDRYVILTSMILGDRQWKIEVSLADRENMGFDLILGRTAIRRRRLVVNAGASFLAGPPKARS